MRRRPISPSPWEPGACTCPPPWRWYYSALYPVIQSHGETGSVRILSRVRFGSESDFNEILTRSEHKTGSLLASTLTAARSRIAVSEQAQSVIQAVKDDIYCSQRKHGASLLWFWEVRRYPSGPMRSQNANNSETNSTSASHGMKI